ncbi:hypothetical protein IE53DRAFT_229199 [Violaceomyces palustris]|uniref:Uncharacterized protein n=1 Tax=Violaceomyces palustris TaxID=1673888 RepID=A0ACD0NPQ1_9BASI|nr:hypothetical protein IE53DRAFT_229199 [Violaceomyces palustris]
MLNVCVCLLSFPCSSFCFLLIRRGDLSQQNDLVLAPDRRAILWGKFEVRTSSGLRAGGWRGQWMGGVGSCSLRRWRRREVVNLFQPSG